MDDQWTTGRLLQTIWGSGLSDEHLEYGGMGGHGDAEVRMVVDDDGKHNTPHIVQFNGGTKMRITYPGRMPICSKCNCLGHARRECQMIQRNRARTYADSVLRIGDFPTLLKPAGADQDIVPEQQTASETPDIEPGTEEQPLIEIVPEPTQENSDEEDTIEDMESISETCKNKQDQDGGKKRGKRAVKHSLYPCHPSSTRWERKACSPHNPHFLATI